MKCKFYFFPNEWTWLTFDIGRALCMVSFGPLMVVFRYRWTAQ